MVFPATAAIWLRSPCGSLETAGGYGCTIVVSRSIATEHRREDTVFVRGFVRNRSGLRRRGTRNALLAVLTFGLLLAPSAARAELDASNLQERVNGALAMMQYCLTPEVTTSSLSINAGEAGINGLSLYQLGGGFTWSKSFPLYLEGNAAYSRYDPVFIFSRGTVQAQVPVVWKSLVGTGGIGWDFQIAPELVLRPIANVSLGRVVSELSGTAGVPGDETGQDLEFLREGRLNSVGYGGSLMLDYEHYRRTYEIDVEGRWTNIWLESIRGTSEAVRGSALAQSASLWTRWRAPTGLRALDRPVRYVLEYAYSYYFGPDGDMLGFNHLNSLGAGLELDTGAWDTLVTRVRLMGRYRVGENVTGWTVGLGISF
jgi:hypothetical protein